MNPINRKPAQQTENIFYGVDVNNKQAVMKEYKRLKQRHRFFTILSIVVLAFLGWIILDFVRVNTMGGKPMVAISKKVENGTLFQGIGYKVLYCDDGERYIASELYKSCSSVDTLTYSQVVYEKLMEYAEKKKIIDMGNLESFKINSLEADEDNDEGGKDYLLDVSFACKDGKNKCFKTGKEYNDPFNIKFYVKINKFNEVYKVLPFKDSGRYYEQLVYDYSEKVKNYLKENNMLVEENLRYYTLALVENNGKYKFRGITYADTYLIKIDYLCKENNDSCIKAFDKKDYEGDYSNLTFYASMFLNSENEVTLVGPREYLDID